MSGIEDPGTPPDLPPEYADTYRDAYLRALAEEAEAGQPAELSVPDRTPEERSSLLWLVVLLVAVVLVVGAYVVGRIVSGDEEPEGSEQPGKVAATTPSTPVTQKPGKPSAKPSEKPDPDPTPELGPTWTGAVEPVTITGVQTRCTAKDSVDAANQPVTFDAENAIDTDDGTAWRCNDPKGRQRLTFEIPAGTEVGEVGLIPGYAKTDPVSGTDRYAENNRITKVRWVLADGVEVVQELDPAPGNRELQTIRVPRTATGTVVLQILEVERGERNNTAISTVAIRAAV